MDQAQRRELIGKYREGYRVVAEALSRLTAEALDRPGAGGGWSPRQIVHHLADSEMTSAIRLRRLIAERQPEIIGYDENEFARQLHYDRPLDASLLAFRAARESTAEILERLDEGEWRREGRHSEVGRYSVETWLEIYSAHAHDHAAQMLATVG